MIPPYPRCIDLYELSSLDPLAASSYCSTFPCQCSPIRLTAAVGKASTSLNALPDSLLSLYDFRT